MTANKLWEQLITIRPITIRLKVQKGLEYKSLEQKGLKQSNLQGMHYD